MTDILATDPDFELVGVAGDGKTAIELCEALRPNVLTMDMMLPVMSGLAATEYIMAHSPTPILIVSSSVNRGELFKTYEALAAGAVDVLEKPPGDETDDAWERRFLSTLKLVSRIRVITHPRARLARSSERGTRSRRRRRSSEATRATRSWPSARRPAVRARSSMCCTRFPRVFRSRCFSCFISTSCSHRPLPNGSTDSRASARPMPATAIRSKLTPDAS